MVAASDVDATPRLALAYRSLSCADSSCSPLESRSTRAREQWRAWRTSGTWGGCLHHYKGDGENLNGTLRGADCKQSRQSELLRPGFWECWGLGGASVSRRVTNVVTLPARQGTRRTST